jgi:prolipoprotein diacylglyceryltransferase
MLTLFRLVFAPPRDLILLLGAAWIGLALTDKRAKNSGFEVKILDNLVFIMAAAYLVGGRLFFAAEHLSAFVQSPASLISLNIDSFDNWGGLATAGIAGFVFGQRNEFVLWATLDALTPLLATLIVGLGLSHLASGAAFGREANVPWAWYEWGANRHPTQIYETIAALLTLGLIWFRRWNFKPGGDFLSFVALTSCSRLIIEAFRGDSTLVLGGLRAAQIVAWIALSLSLLGLELLVFPRRLQPASAKRKRDSKK